ERADYLARCGEEALATLEMAMGTVESSRECRDCIALPSDTRWARMRSAGEPTFPWANLEACREIRDSIQKRFEEAREEIAAARMVVISVKDEARMTRDGTHREFVEGIHRSGRKLLVSADPNDYRPLESKGSTEE
ncbi:MAG: hypothetical protein ABSF83_14715, partial [Nitrososphaerales archaeon]